MSKEEVCMEEEEYSMRDRLGRKGRWRGGKIQEQGKKK